LWHAGEPLVVPVADYSELFESAHLENREHKREFQFTIQTNATLITERWVDLFRRYDVTVGVSIDGPAFIHDRERKDRSRRPTHARTMAGVRLLQQGGIAPPAIAVLTNYSLDYPDEIFDFFQSNDLLNIGFNIEAIGGANASSSIHSYQRVVDFFRRFISLVNESSKPMAVREIRIAYGAFRHLDRLHDDYSARGATNRPFDIITVDTTGDYSTYSPELRTARSARSLHYSNFKMGNVLSDAFDDMLDNQTFKQVHQEVELGIARCQASCAYWFTCFGGTPVSKFFETGRFDTTETHHCLHERQAVVDALVGYLADRCAPQAGSQSIAG
jgi:uncharacterized protein